MSDSVMNYIGVVHSGLTDLKDVPSFYSDSDQVGTLEIFPEFIDGLDGVAAGQTIVLLSWFHKAKRDVLKVYPRGDKSRGLRGVFSTRSPMRPNPIGLSELEVLAVDAGRITVKGLDVLDQTPILDIKKQAD